MHYEFTFKVKTVVYFLRSSFSDILKSLSIFDPFTERIKYFTGPAQLDRLLHVSDLFIFITVYWRHDRFSFFEVQNEYMMSLYLIDSVSLQAEWDMDCPKRDREAGSKLNILFNLSVVCIWMNHSYNYCIAWLTNDKWKGKKSRNPL